MHARHLGAVLQERAGREPGREQRLQEALDIDFGELQKIYAGRMFLTWSEVCTAAEVCGMEPKAFLDEAQAREGAASESREQVLDLIDVYLDLKEAVEAERS